MSTEIAVAVLGFVGGVVAAIVAAVATRSTGREANATTSWTAITTRMDSELTRLSNRVDALEQKLDLEREERRTLAQVLRSAWTHILVLGEQIRGLGAKPEDPPPDLTAWMRHDGLVVDRVETTISRTTVTDTRDPTAEPHEQITYQVRHNRTDEDPNPTA